MSHISSVDFFILHDRGSPLILGLPTATGGKRCGGRNSEFASKNYTLNSVEPAKSFVTNNLFLSHTRAAWGSPLRGFGALFSGSVAKNRFQLKELFKARFAPLSAVAGLFVASETTTEIHPRAIQMNVA